MTSISRTTICIRIHCKLENQSNTGLTWWFYNLLCCVRYLRTSTGNWPAVWSWDRRLGIHTRETGHSFNNKDFHILDKEEQWHRRGIKEAIWKRVEQPSLNKKGGLPHNLSHAWVSALKRIPSRLSHDHNNGSVACRSPEVPDAT